MFLDVVCEDGQDGVVVLKKGAGGVGEVVVADVFVGGGLGVGLAGFDVDAELAVVADGVGGEVFLLGGSSSVVRGIGGIALSILTEKNGCASLVVSKLVLHPLSLALHALPDDVGANGAVFNVHDFALALAHEADVRAARKLGFGAALVPPAVEARRAVEMRRQLRAVAVLQGAADGVEDGGDQLGGQVGKVAEGLVNDAPLAAELLGVVEHLELAAAAGSEILALDAGVIAQRGGLDDGDEVGDGLVLAAQVAEDLDSGDVAGDGEGHDVDLVGAGLHGQAVAGGRELEDFDVSLGSLSGQVLLRLGGLALGWCVGPGSSRF